MRSVRSFTLAGVVALSVGAVLPSPASAAEGETITTTVFTDESGTYYFPALPAAKYRVWAQALGFETARGAVDLASARKSDLVLKPITDPERQIRQLPGDLMLAGLPEETPDDVRMRRSCATTAPAATRRATSCSTGSTRRAGAPSSS